MENLTLMQGFEWYLPNDGDHWNRLKKEAKELSDNGINMIWLPPAYKGAAGGDSVGYDVYDTYDLGEFDQKGSVETKYGSKKEYLACVRELQKNNIKVLADIVLNHMMGADATEKVEATSDDQGNRNREISGMHEIEAWTSFTFPGRNGKYSKETWSEQNFSGADWDQEQKQNGVFAFDGKRWNGETDSENGNYDYLMGADLDMDNPDTVRKLYDWSKWYYDTVHMDGFRLDAVKHISFEFYKNWLDYIRDYAKEDLFTVGEYWSQDIGKLNHYLDVTENKLSLFDVPLHFSFLAAASSNGDFDFGSLRNNSLAAGRPMNAVTFVDNHDTQPGQALSSWIPEWFKPLAYAIILLQQNGVPCIFYGDYYGIAHDNIAPVACLKELCRIRKDFAYGDERDYFDNSDVVGFTRTGDGDHNNSGLAVLLTDRCAGEKYMIVNPAFAKKEMHNALDCQMAPVTLDENGGAVFSVNGGSVSVWIF